MGPAPFSCSVWWCPSAVDDLAEGDGPAVAELAGPVAELVAAVAGGAGRHALDDAVAAKHLGEVRRPPRRSVTPAARAGSATSGDHARRRGAATGVGPHR